MGGRHKATTRAGRKADVGKRPRGGAREGSGRKPAWEEAARILAQTATVDDAKANEILAKLAKEGFRLPPNPTDGTKELVAFCRAKLMQIVINPTRHAQAQTAILKMFLEEACGKVAENHNVDQTVNVVIKKTGSPAEAAAPAAAQPAPVEEITPAPQNVVSLPIPGFITSEE